MIHHGIRAAYRVEAARFARALVHPEATQRAVLRRIVSRAARAPHHAHLTEHTSYERFAAHVPLTDYEAWRALIDHQRVSGRPELNLSVSRYEPTSGSTGARKWIPYTPDFLAEMNRAAQAWLFDLYRAHPAILRGRHFWSLSFIPLELRGQLDTNDAELFPFWQRLILKRMMAFHPAIQHAKSAEAAWWATKLFLASCADLSFISVWSPSYALNLLREIFAERELIAQALDRGAWLRYAADLQPHAAPARKDFPARATTEAELVRLMWPSLALVSTWDSASARAFIPALRAALGTVPIQGKGLWATEGVVTIPWREKLPLAVRSHFYEFRCLDTQRILPSWRLERDQFVQPIVTAATGLFRYALPDRMQVTGFVKNTPSLSFQGRLGGVDLVGEKISFENAQAIIARLQARFPALKLFCLGARREGTQGHYSILGVGDAATEAVLASALEAELRAIHHYAVARELHQLLPAGAILREHSQALTPLFERNAVKGQNKPEAIVLLS